MKQVIAAVGHGLGAVWFSRRHCSSAAKHSTLQLRRMPCSTAGSNAGVAEEGGVVSTAIHGTTDTAINNTANGANLHRMARFSRATVYPTGKTPTVLLKKRANCPAPPTKI